MRNMDDDLQMNMRREHSKSDKEDSMVRERRLKLLDEIQSMINTHKGNNV
jgi:uncharacterized protein YdcH (DUF465 family)